MYKIIRFCFDYNHPDNHKVIKTGLTFNKFVFLTRKTQEFHFPKSKHLDPI